MITGKRNVISRTKKIDFAKIKTLDGLLATMNVLFDHFIVDEQTEKRLAGNALTYLIVEKVLSPDMEKLRAKAKCNKCVITDEEIEKLKKEGVIIVTEENTNQGDPVNQEEAPIAAEAKPAVEAVVKNDIDEAKAENEAAAADPEKAAEPEVATAEEKTEG